MRRSSLTSAPLLLAALVFPVARAEVPIPPDHYTKAELNGFRSTPTYDEVREFLLRLTRTSPYLHVENFGTTGQGRRMAVVVASKEMAFTPEEAWKSGKPVVLILNSIHGGEVDGTDACLILLRDLALANEPEILNAVTLVVVPVYNVDGHERISRYNRPNQDGPVEGMGFRTSARGADLNRDFMKAEEPETRALLSLAAAWKPSLFIDDHVTDGVDFQPSLTLTWASEPATPKPLAAWLHETLPPTLRELERGGRKTLPYVDLVDPLDPRKGIDPGPTTPRYSTGYFALRGAGTILVETHAIKPYAERVLVNVLFLKTLLRRIAANPKPLVEAGAAARRETRTAAVGTPVVLDSETDRSRPEMVDFPTYVANQVVSPVTGKPVLRYDRSKTISFPVPFFPHVKPTVTVPRPAAYLVPAGWPRIEEALKAHGIRYRVVEEPLSLEVGTYRARKATFAARSYQGLTRVTAAIERGRERRTVPAGSLYVPLDSELANVAIALLEPEGPDSLFAWGLLSTALEQREWIDSRVLDPLAEEMLAKDPKLRKEWETRLAEPAFAADAPARTQFFYSRTPYWEETIGLVPVYRLESPLPEPAAPASR